MRRLNAWQITAFPERQRSNECSKSSPALRSPYLYLQAGGGTVRGEAQWACCCTAVRVPSKAGGSKRLKGRTPVMWSLTSSTPDGGRADEGERERTRERRSEETLRPTDRTVRPWCDTNESQTCRLRSTCTRTARVSISASWIFCMPHIAARMLAMWQFDDGHKGRLLA